MNDEVFAKTDAYFEGLPPFLDSLEKSENAWKIVQSWKEIMLKNEKKYP